MKVSDIVVFLKTEAFLLSAIPAIVIVVSFVFEVGYLSFYGVPLSVVEIDVHKIIVSCACLIILFYWIAEVISGLMKIARKFSKVVGAFFVSLVPGLIIALFALLFKAYLVLWAAAAAVLLLYLPLAIELRRDRYKKDEDVERDQGSLVGRAKEFLLGGAVVFGLSYGVGYSVASDKVKYFVVGDDRALIEMYGDTAVLAYFGGQKGMHTLTGEIELVNLAEFQLKGRFQRLGPLTPAETLTP